jgi:hypothetical protein
LGVGKLTLVSEELVCYVHVELLKENSGVASVSATNAAGLNTVLVILVWVSLPWIRYHLVITKSRYVVNVQLLKYDYIWAPGWWVVWKARLLEFSSRIL